MDEMLNPLIGKDSFKQAQTLSFFSWSLGSAQMISTFAFCTQIDFRLSNSPLR